MKVYENVIIGNFLFALGFAIRARCPAAPLLAGIKLTQQTPADQLLGDLSVQFDGTYRLIEFKETHNRDKKEKSRHQLLSEALRKIPDQSLSQKLTAISRSIHWYIETDVKQQTLITGVAPYLDLDCHIPKKERALESFIESIAEAVAHPVREFTSADLESYIKWVRWILGGDKKSGSSGLILMIASDGTLEYLPMQDLMEMRLPTREWFLQTLHDRGVEFGKERTPRSGPVLERKYEGPEMEL